MDDQNRQAPGEPEVERAVDAGAAEGVAEAAFDAVAGVEVGAAGGTGPAGEERPAAGIAGEPAADGTAAAEEKLLRARDVVAGLLERLGVEADVEVRDQVEAIGCSVRVRSGGGLFATGQRGQVLEAAEYLVNKMVNREAEGRKWVKLELGGFPEVAPDPAMERMALRLGEAAKRIGKTLTVVPMQSRERRRVHVALAEVDGLRTRSEGDGLFRRLLVEPKC